MLLIIYSAKDSLRVFVFSVFTVFQVVVSSCLTVIVGIFLGFTVLKASEICTGLANMWLCDNIMILILVKKI